MLEREDIERIVAEHEQPGAPAVPLEPLAEPGPATIAAAERLDAPEPTAP